MSNRLAVRSFTAVIVIASLLAWSVPSDAAPVGATCTGNKLKAAGKRADAKLSCHATGANKGLATAAACLTTAETKFNTAFTKAETKPPCYATGDAAAIAAKVDAFVTSMAADFRPALTLSKCSHGQLKAAGKKASAKLTCHQKAAKKGVSVDPACLTKAEDTFDDKFAKAVAKGDCLSGSSAATIEAAVDAMVADVADDLRPGPLSKCTGRKLERTAQKQLDKLKCHGNATKDGITVDPACLMAAEAKFAAGFTDAEVFGDCLMPTGDTAAIEAEVDLFVGDVETALRPALTISKCSSKKFTKTAQETNRKLVCRSHSINNGLPASTTCPDPADVDAFAAAENSADCLTLADAAAIEALIDAFVANVVPDLVGTTTTTSTTTTTL